MQTSNIHMEPIAMASTKYSSPQEEAADRRLAAIFLSSKFLEKGNFDRIVTILKEHPKLAHHSYKTVYPNAAMVPFCGILTSNALCNLQHVQTVLELNPSAVMVRHGDNADTALHLACRHGVTAPVAEFILSQNPAAIGALNGSGRPPLECLLPSLKSNAGVQRGLLLTLNVLLQSAPEAITVQNGRGQNLLETALNLGGWSTCQALECLAERYSCKQKLEEEYGETLLGLFAKVDKARRLRPTAKQSIRCALLRADPGLWAG